MREVAGTSEFDDKRNHAYEEEEVYAGQVTSALLRFWDGTDFHTGAVIGALLAAIVATLGRRWP